jgi:signal transduction histidine kinase
MNEESIQQNPTTMVDGDPLALQHPRGSAECQTCANARLIVADSHEADCRTSGYERLLDGVASLAQTFATARDLLTIYRSLRDFIIASNPCSSLFISLYDQTREMREGVYLWYAGQEMDVASIGPVPVGRGSTGMAIKTGEVVINNDFARTINGRRTILAGFDQDPRMPQSVLIAPMVIMGRTIGAVEAQTYDLGAYGRQHAVAVRMAANLAAVAIENVRLLDQERKHQEELRQSQKMEAIGRLAGGIAHDFNNLLTAINGYSGMALMQLTAGDPLSDSLQEIKKAGERAAALTCQLLAFSRKQVLQPKTLDLNSVVNELNKMLRRIISEDIELVMSLGQGLGRVKADPGQIEQVIMNLVVNARDAMPEGGRLTVATCEVEIGEGAVGLSPGSYVTLWVTDTGCGMDAETLSHIFEPFFTTKLQGKGTGLGLSTVYGIVKQSGGHIEVESEAGLGTTFTVYLPRVEQPPDTVARSGNSNQLPRGSETILLVEDEETVRKLIRSLLEMCGYTVLEAAGGGEAILLCEQHRGPLHLLMTDVVMPHMNGHQVVERVKLLRPDLKVIYMSGYAENSVLPAGLPPGTAFLQKPFGPDSLALKVREILGSDR